MKLNVSRKEMSQLFSDLQHNPYVSLLKYGIVLERPSTDIFFQNLLSYFFFPEMRDKSCWHFGFHYKHAHTLLDIRLFSIALMNI